MFLLSNEVTAALTTKAHKPTENEIADALWDRFAQEADLNVINGREWSKADAQVKAKDRVRELSNGSFSFVSRSDRTKLMPGRKDVPRPTLLEAQKAQAELDKILSDFFGELSKGLIPRSTVRITMGVGKTAGAIEKLKAYLKGRIGQLVEIYVPQHHLGKDWKDKLIASSKGNLGVNAKVVRVLPRTGGKLDSATNTHVHPVLCQRADYVRDLERNGHAIYSNACLSQSANARCIYFDQCEYLDQFRPADGSADNIVRIYTHTTLFQNRNEFERQKAPNLVIIDESFVASAVSDMPAIKTNDIIAHVRTATNPQLGFDLVEGLRAHHGELSYLRDKGFDGSDFSAVYLEALNPKQPFSAQSMSSVGTKSAKLYKALSRLRDLAVQELNDEGKSAFEQLSFDGKNDQVDGKSDQVVLCEHREIRVNGSTPVLYLDATADPLITEAYLPGLRHHVVDVRQLAEVSQVTDRTGSNNSWNERIPAEKANLASSTYDPSHNDIASLIQVLNSWVEAGEKPLLVAHKALADYIKAHPKRAEGVSVAHFMSLRGSNDYEDCSVIFVTGRNQPPFEEIERQARSVFGNSGHALVKDDLSDLPKSQVEYWLSDRSPHPPAAMTLPSFSDPRIDAVLKQIREAETLQVIARLRLVWATYQKRVFLLSNLPVEMPVDHLIQFEDLIPDKLELELMKTGDLPLAALGLRKMRPDFGYSEDAAKKQIARSKASDPKSLLKQLPTLLRTSVQIATFKAGDKRKTTHNHLFLPKGYTGDPLAATYKLWTEGEVLAHLEKGWVKGAVIDLRLGFLYGP